MDAEFRRPNHSDRSRQYYSRRPVLGIPTNALGGSDSVIAMSTQRKESNMLATVSGSRRDTRESQARSVGCGAGLMVSIVACVIIPGCAGSADNQSQRARPSVQEGGVSPPGSITITSSRDGPFGTPDYHQRRLAQVLESLNVEPAPDENTVRWTERIKRARDGEWWVIGLLPSPAKASKFLALRVLTTDGGEAVFDAWVLREGNNVVGETTIHCNLMVRSLGPARQ
jgi:hypothetical protein